jgi:hypothetical protein
MTSHLTQSARTPAMQAPVLHQPGPACPRGCDAGSQNHPGLRQQQIVDGYLALPSSSTNLLDPTLQYAALCAPFQGQFDCRGGIFQVQCALTHVPLAPPTACFSSQTQHKSFSVVATCPCLHPCLQPGPLGLGLHPCQTTMAASTPAAQVPPAATDAASQLAAVQLGPVVTVASASPSRNPSAGTATSQHLGDTQMVRMFLECMGSALLGLGQIMRGSKGGVLAGQLQHLAKHAPCPCQCLSLPPQGLQPLPRLRDADTGRTHDPLPLQVRLRSVQSEHPCIIEFVNTTTEFVNTLWLDFEGNEVRSACCCGRGFSAQDQALAVL